MKIEFLRGTEEARPLLSIEFLGHILLIFFGWQRPSIIWWK